MGRYNSGILDSANSDKTLILKFTELQKILEINFETEKLSDIAHELKVTPQVINNWKIKDKVPYKYVVKVREKLKRQKKQFVSNDYFNPVLGNIQDTGTQESLKLIIEDIFKIYKSVVKQKKYLVFSILFFLLVGLVHVSIFKEPKFVSSARILPVSNSNASSLSSFASQFGVSVGRKDASSLADSKLYPEIIKSRRLASMVIEDKFDTEKYGQDISLKNILTNQSVKDTQTSHLNKRSIKSLLDMIEVKNSKSSLITISVKTFEPLLASEIINSVIKNLVKLIKTFKISEVEEKKEFIINRIRDVESTLMKNEDQYKTFREQNRNINASPALLLEAERFQRTLDVQKEVYITLKSELERVQIDEYEDVSIIQILDGPESSGDVTLNYMSIIFLYLFLGFCVGMLIILSKDWYVNNEFIFKMSETSSI